MSLYLEYPKKADESRPVLASTFKCWNCDEMHPVKVKKDWGLNEVCPRCDLHLFDEAEKRDKRI